MPPLRPTSGTRDPGASEEVIGLSSPAQAIRGWIVACWRLVVPVIAPLLIVMLIHSEQRGFWFHFVAIALYASSVGAAFFAVGLAASMIARRRGGDDRIAHWDLGDDHGGPLVLAAFLGGERSWAGLALGMGSPFVGVNVLARRFIYSGAGSEGRRRPGVFLGHRLSRCDGGFVAKSQRTENGRLGRDDSRGLARSTNGGELTAHHVPVQDSAWARFSRTSGSRQPVAGRRMRGDRCSSRRSWWRCVASG